MEEDRQLDEMRALKAVKVSLSSLKHVCDMLQGVVMSALFAVAHDTHVCMRMGKKTVI